MFIVVSEDDEGIWWDDPVGFYDKKEAVEFINEQVKLDKLPKGYEYVLYSCREENQLLF